MPKHSGINRPYMAGEIEKTPQEKQRELDEKMQKFLAKGGEVHQQFSSVWAQVNKVKFATTKVRYPVTNDATLTATDLL